MPARMKPADDKREVLFREALMEGRRRNPQILPPMNGGESKQTNKNHTSGACHLKQKWKIAYEKQTVQSITENNPKPSTFITHG